MVNLADSTPTFPTAEEELENFISTHGITFPVLHDPDWDIAFPYFGGSISYPKIFIIGADMVVRANGPELEGATFAEDFLEGHILDVVHTRDPIDVEMIMDVSSSMNSSSPSDPGGDSKLIMMRQTADMVTNFLNDHGQVDDRMGLIWFTDDVEEYVAPSGDKLISVQTDTLDLKSQIASHGTGDCTAMGAGLQTAFTTLSASAHKKFAILCTDGMQNVEPKVTETAGHLEIIDSGGYLCGGHSSVAEQPGVNITSYNTKVHTVGIGITASYEGLLQEIANQTGGFYKGTHDPETDLDLIYFTNLANCMAAGSPSVIHHNAGEFFTKECETVESFCLNRSARKITVILSWQKKFEHDLTFWLRAPGGVLLKLDRELKRYGTYCMATIYLPRHQNGGAISHVGQWHMIIRGEAENGMAKYHAMVIAEDKDVKIQVDYPRKSYEVGDVLPIKMRLMEMKKHISEVQEIIMEVSQLRAPLAELLANYKISQYELERCCTCATAKGKSSMDPLSAKLHAMEVDPEFSHILKPVRKKRSLKEGTLSCEINKKEIVLPVSLRQPGLCSFTITLRAETKESGPICRKEMVSVFVGAGKADPERSRFHIMETMDRKRKGAVISFTPRNSQGHLLGAGLCSELRIKLGKQFLKAKVGDQLNGTYRAEFILPDKKVTKGKGTVIKLFFQENVVWEGRL